MCVITVMCGVISSVLVLTVMCGVIDRVCVVLTSNLLCYLGCGVNNSNV